MIIFGIFGTIKMKNTFLQMFLRLVQEDHKVFKANRGQEDILAFKESKVHKVFKDLKEKREMVLKVSFKIKIEV